MKIIEDLSSDIKRNENPVRLHIIGGLGNVIGLVPNLREIRVNSIQQNETVLYSRFRAINW